MRFWDASAVVPLLFEQKQTGVARKLHGADPEMAVWWGTTVECHSAIARMLRQQAIDRITKLLAGEPDDLTDIPLDLDGVPDFNRGVYAIARTIPPGKTMTYGDIAKRLGGLELSRDVGQALGRNPCPVVVPCHRVLAAGGQPGGFSANGGVATKLKMLAIEGAYVNHTPNLFD